MGRGKWVKENERYKLQVMEYISHRDESHRIGNIVVYCKSLVQ